MVGRNEPCPCGSGKKYKKCCEKNETIQVAAVYADELERVLQTFYDKYPLKKDWNDYGTIVNKWKEALGESLDVDMIEAIAMDDLFFHERVDIWTDYLQKARKEFIRPATLDVLASWDDPKMLVAQVEEVLETHMKVRDVLTNEEMYLRREGKKPIPVGVYVFCYRLPDDTRKVQHYLAISSMIFFPVTFKEVFVKANKAFTKANITSVAYWKEHSIALWQELVKQGFEGDEFTDFEAEVFEVAEQFVEEHGGDAHHLLDILEDYVVERRPKARKAAAIAAGAIRFGNEEGIFEPIDVTVKAIAEHFDVSASSLNKYYTELKEYYAARI